MSTGVPNQDLEALETELLLEGVYRHYGFDFREYAPVSLQRRIRQAMQREQVATISALQERVLHDPACLEQFLLALTVNVTAMFRDPAFYRGFRERVVPLLHTYPSVQIWHAGCATGEEVYSMAILLAEEGLLDRCRLYATDLSESVLDRARAGIFPLSTLPEYTANYQAAGGKRTFSDYYTTADGAARLASTLLEAIVFAQHNLVTDAAFNAFHVVCCRNVMIYFRKPLQRRVQDLLYASLIRFGVLGLGNKESLAGTAHEADYSVLDLAARLYRRVH